MAPIGGERQPDRSRQRRGGGAGVGLRGSRNQVREFHRLLGKKTLKAEILKEALEQAMGLIIQLRLSPLPPKDDTR
jgi:hypothetical protein